MGVLDCISGDKDQGKKEEKALEKVKREQKRKVTLVDLATRRGQERFMDCDHVDNLATNEIKTPNLF